MLINKTEIRKIRDFRLHLCSATTHYSAVIFHSENMSCTVKIILIYIHQLFANVTSGSRHAGGCTVSASGTIMRSINEANQYFHSKNQKHPNREWSPVQTTVPNEYAVLRGTSVFYMGCSAITGL